MNRWIKSKEGDRIKYVLISLLATLDAALAVILVYPNEFAPTSVLGIATMVQYLFGIPTGYQFFLVNIPLLSVAFFKLNRSYAVKNAFYVAFFSTVSLSLQGLIAAFDWQGIEYVANTTEGLFLVAMAYGAFEGIAYSTASILGGSTGGTDIAAALVNKYKPRFNTVWILFSIKVIIASISYFVYGRRILPVIVGVVCGFTASIVSDNILKGRETALKFEVITDVPTEISRELMQRLGHGVTCVQSTGMYEGAQNCLLICVINKRQRYDFEQIIANHENTFAYCCPVKCTYGYFDR